MLGIAGDTRFDAEAVTLAPGEGLLFYTDGVVEPTGRGEEEFGLPRLENLTAESLSGGAAATLDRIVRATREFSGAETYMDDFTLMAVLHLPDGHK